MNNKPDSAAFAATLRRRAEAQLQERSIHPWPDSMVLSNVSSPERLFHELQVHQVELELQNAELIEARERTEVLLEKYTDLYDFALVGYLTVSHEGKIRLVNLTAARLLGRPRAELTGLPLDWQICAEAQPIFKTFLKQVFAHEAKQTCELTLGPEGRPRRIVSLEAERSLDRQECRVVMTDITERRQAEEKVRISEIRYRRLFEAAHDGVILLDPGTRQITDANPFMTKLLGYPRDLLVGKELFEIGLLKDEAASQEMFRKLKRNHQVRYEDLPLKSRDGRHQEVEVVANLYAENGHTVIQCNIRDITERKQAMEILRRNEALFSSLIAQAPVGVYVVDEQFRLAQCNAIALAVFQKVHPLIGRDFSEIHHLIWPKRVSDEVITKFRHTLATGKAYKSPGFTERRLDTKKTESYEWQLQRLTLPDGTHGVVAFFNDVTERKNAEETKRRLTQLAAANLEANRDIARRRVVETTLRKSDEVQRALLAESRLLHSQLQHLTRRIITAQEDERKTISRDLHDDVLQTLVGINVALATLTKGTGRSQLHTKITQTRQLVKKSVEAVHQFARDLRPAVLDDLGLVPALRGYVKNLSKRNGLKVSLSASGAVESLSNSKRTVLYRVAQEGLTNVIRHAHASTATVSLADIPGGVALEITDNGRSFEVEKTLQAKKFKRLGLIGIKERVAMVGGTLQLTSTPGQGTTLRVTLPV